MVIDLKPEQQRLIELAVGSGAYRGPAEVVEQAFEIIREQLEVIAARIEKSFAQAERGELIDGDAALKLLRERRAERLNPQG